MDFHNRHKPVVQKEQIFRYTYPVLSKNYRMSVSFLFGVPFHAVLF